MANIVYTENPLNAKVTLSIEDLLILKYKIEIEDLRNIIYSAQYSLKPGRNYNQELAFKILDEAPEEVKHSLSNLNYYIDSLNHSHCGDCTAFPATCDRCLTEDYIGINTFNSSKSVGSKLFYMYKAKPDITAREVLQHLIDNPFVATEHWHHENFDSLTKNHNDTIEFMKNYIKEKL